MGKKNKLAKVFLCFAVLGLASCGSQQGGTSGYQSSFLTSKFASRFAYRQNAGVDGIYTSFTDEHPVSLDDTITINSYIYSKSEEIPGYVEGGKVTIEDSVRTDVQTTFGQGFPIIGLGDNCFKDQTGITSLTLSKNITSIGANAFSGMTGLTSLNLEDLANLASIGNGAFDSVPWYSNYLASKSGQALVFGKILYAFSGTISSGSYTVPEGIEQIAAGAFKNQTNLTSVSLPSSLKSIGDEAFMGTGLTSVSIPDSVSSIGSGAFSNCLGLTKADLGKAELASGVLTGDTNITELAFSGNITAASLLGSSDFSKIVKVTLQGEEAVDSALNGMANVTSLSLKGAKRIGKNVFTGMTSLTSISDADGVEFVSSNSLKSTPWYAGLADGAVYLGHNFLGFKGTQVADALKADATGVSEEAMKEMTVSFTLPSTLKYIGDSAFSNNTSLTEINLPQIVSVGYQAFYGCSEILKVVLADNCTLGEEAFSGASKVTSAALPYGESLNKLFGKTLKNTLTEYTFLNGPETVANKMFYDYAKLTKVTFCSTLTEIGNYAFANCIGLTSLDFPVNLTSIKVMAFSNCSSLASVHFNTKVNTAETKLKYLGLTDIGQFAFFKCTALKTASVNSITAEEGTFMLPESLLNINSCFLMGTAVNKIALRVIYYYLDNHIDITTEDGYMTFASDWNADAERGTDSSGNPKTIPYEIVTIKA